MPSYSLEQQLFTLALVAYQGYAELSEGQSGQEKTTRKIRQALADFAPVAGRWELVWGPGVYRSRFSLFEDVVVFVARDLEAQGRPRYAVSVRGTNPIASSDWILGDFWVSQEVAWGWGEPAEGAAITMSSALGLAAMQALRAPTAGVEGVGRDGLVAGIQGALRRMERGVMAPIEAGVDELLEQIEALAPVLEQVDAESRLQALAQHHRHPLWKKLLAFLDGVLSGLSAQLQQALLHHLIEQARDQQAQLEGQTLASFLRGITEREGPEIRITGHSKGAALASLLAQWLADTQGPDAQEHERWDPQRRATIGCTTFASPSPGNLAFSERFGRRFPVGAQPLTLRVANHSDIVTHAWEQAAILEIPTLYPDPPVAPQPGLGALVELVAAQTRDKGYTHVGGGLDRFGFPMADTQGLFPTQVVYQHLEAYLHHMGVAEVLDREKVFGLPLIGGDPFASSGDAPA